MHRREIIHKIRETLITFPAKITVILFGSEASGDVRADSDIDLLILLEDEEMTEKKSQEVTYPLFSISHETGILINPVVMLKKQWGKVKNPFYENVTREGIMLL